MLSTTSRIDRKDCTLCTQIKPEGLQWIIVKRGSPDIWFWAMMTKDNIGTLHSDLGRMLYDKTSIEMFQVKSVQFEPVTNSLKQPNLKMEIVKSKDFSGWVTLSIFQEPGINLFEMELRYSEITNAFDELAKFLN